MPRTDPRVDAYIAAAAPFARPILVHLRAVVHAGCSDAEETIKWGMPFFMHRGKNMAFMAAFKAHCGFGFVHGEKVLSTGKESQAMGQFGRIWRLADLPGKRALLAHVKAAMALIDDGVAPSRGAGRKSI